MSASYPSPPSAIKRDAWIDLLRGIAVVIMLETHCVNVLLRNESTPTNWLNWLHFFNGLAAPTFLFIAGYLQGLGIRRAIATSRPLLSRPRLLRLLTIYLLGMFLQIPWHAWLQGDFGIESWRHLAAVNILQNLAVCLFVLLLIGTWFQRRFDLITAILLLSVVLVSSSALTWQTGIFPIDAWLNRNTGSIFPFFPWFAFCAIGSLMGRWQPSWKIWTPLAFLMIFGGSWLQNGPFNSAHPGFFCERLGYVFILAVFAYLSAKIFQASWLQLIGRQSLFIYVAHLIILHAMPIPGGTLETVWGNQFTISQTALSFAALLLICLAFAWLKEQRKIPAAKPLPAMTPSN